MKKILSCFVVLFAAISLYATDLNIYASGLKVTTSGGSSVGIQYTLNAPATSLDLKVLNGSSLVTTIAIPAGDGNVNFTKGTHNVNIDITDLAEGSYNWSIVANAAANGLEAPAEVTYPLAVEGYSYYSPQGVAVDNSFESPYFGRIYVSQSLNGASDGGSDFTKVQPRGIYIYNPDLTFVNGKTTAVEGYDGGLAGTGTFKRLAIDEAGNVYVCTTNAANKGVYRMDPANPSANFATVLSNKSVNAIDLVGTTLTTLEDIGVGTGTLNTYDISTIPAGDAISSVSTSGASYIYFANGNCSVQDDKHGGIWLAEFRGRADYHMLVHLNALGEQDFVVGAANYTTYLPGFCQRGVVAVNNTGDMIAVSANKSVRVFNVTYDLNTGVPALDSLYEITRAVGTYTDGIAFDLAGNLYVVSASSELFYAYAFPKAVNSFETPAPSTSMIVRSSEVKHVTGISLDQTSASIEKGHTLTLVPTIVPGDASNPTVIWTSANDEIASVSNTGVVTAVGEGGPVTITATTQDGGFTATCDVTVFMNHVSSVTVEPNEITLGVGFKQQLTATILPVDATNKTYTWSSDDAAIATVTNGMVTAIAVGSTTIKATAEDGGIVGSCNVVVSPAVAHISAYDLAVAPVATGYEFSFKANMATTVASLVFYDKANGNLVGDYPIANVVSGNNVVFVNAFALPGNGQDLTWGVRLVGADNAAFSKIHESAEITGRCHLVVDASPESPYMGKAYVFARNSSSIGGMYTVDQQFNISARCNFGKDYNYGFMRPSIDETGKVWAMDWSDGHSGVWVIDPANPNTWTCVYQGSRQSSGLVKNGDVEVGGSGNACFVYGKGENRVLFANQEDFTDSSLGNHPVAIYNIGSAYTWDAAPTAINVTPNNGNANNAIYAVEHGYWVSQNRSAGQNTPGASALQFFAMDGTLLANFGGDPRINGCAGAGFTVDPVNNKLYMVDGSSNILEFEVTYDAQTHVPTLELVGKHYVGYANISSMSMDFAGNLYVTAGPYASATSNKMRMAVYSPSTHGNNITIVPAPAASIVHMVPVAQLYEFDTQSGDWALNAGTAMTEKATNVFEGEFTFSGADRYITFSTTQGASAADWDGIAGGRLSAVADGDNYWITGTSTSADFVMGGSKCYMVPATNAGKFHVTVNFNTMKVEFTKILADNLYEFDNATGSWNLGAGVALTNVEDNVFEGEFTIAAEKNLLFATANADNWGDLNAAQLHINAVDDYWVNGDGVAEISGNVNNSFLIKAAGKYRFHINLGTNTITITQLSALVDVMSEIEYATYYNSQKGYTMPANVTGYTFNYPGGLTERFTAGQEVPAGVALVLSAPAGTVELELLDNVDPIVGIQNQLLGTDVDATTTGPDADLYLFYGLSLANPGQGLLPDPQSVGFYWMADNGAAFTNKAHKAYLALKQNVFDSEFLAPAILFNGNNATNIENVESQEKAVKFIQNGQLYIQKNGVVYDAMGRVVK